MSSIEIVNYFLESIPKLRDRFNFMDDVDSSFLMEYFQNSKVYFSLMDSLHKYECDRNFRITDTQLDEITNSVRKVSKKYRDAAKLLHILKKPHLRAFFTSLQQLDNQVYISNPDIDDLYEIYIESEQNNDVQDYPHESGTESENSEYSDEIINDRKNLPCYQDVAYSVSNHSDTYPEYQIIGIQRDHKQPLGITVIKHDFEYCKSKITRCMVERILVNSIVDKQGLLQVGDIILELNDQPIDTTNALQRLLNKLTGTLNFKIIKSTKRSMQSNPNLEKSYVRALFDYDPSKDKLIPNESIGLSFTSGDVFEILNRDDPNFWQVLPLGCTTGQALLVPSQGLQERRIALIDDIKLKSNDNSGLTKVSRKKSKKNELFRAQDAADIISEADLRTYEEVVKFPPSRIPCLLLLGPPGIGKRAIKHLIVQKEPNRFAFPIQDTTEPKRGRDQPLLNHVDKNVMSNDIKSGLYVCLKESNGETYGIKSSTIRELINQKKTVVLDCQPKDVYSLKLPIFNPYAILIAAPSLSIMEAMQKEGLSKNLTKNKRSTGDLQDIIDQSIRFQSTYQHLINSVIINENINKTVFKISSIVSEVENSDSWIPAAWENDIIPLQIIPKDISRDQLKSPDNLSINQTTLQRRFEKKNEKSLSFPDNKQIIVGKSHDTSGSDNSSNSDSELEIMIAKPLKYSSVEKDIEDEVINDTVDAQIKPKQRMSLTRQTNQYVTKGENPHMKDQTKLQKQPPTSSKPLNTNLKVSASSNSRKESEVKEKEPIEVHEKLMVKPHIKATVKLPEKIIKPQEKSTLNSKLPRKDVENGNDIIKMQEKESKNLPVRDTKKSPERDIQKISDKEIKKSQDRENIKIQPSISVNKNQKAPKLVKMKDSSSSDMSDTTSEDESVGIKENRV